MKNIWKRRSKVTLRRKGGDEQKNGRETRTMGYLVFRSLCSGQRKFKTFKATTPLDEEGCIPLSTEEREGLLNKKKAVEGLHSPTMSSNPENGDGTGKEVLYKCKVDTTEFLIDPVAAATIQRKAKQNETMKLIIKEKIKMNGGYIYSYCVYLHDRDKMYD